MSFLSKSILWGLFAAAIPVIIHLLNRRRFRTVKWAATTFLLKASRESRGKKKLKHFLILACRALAIGALIFAVARPLVGGFFGSGGGSVNTVVLVLDRSASMELRSGDGEPSHRESVITKVAEAIETIGSPRLLLLDSATGEIIDVPSPDALPELSTTIATDTQADIPALVNRAVAYLDETQPGKSEIWIASDLQRGDWKPSDSKWGAIRANIEALATKTKLRIITPGESEKLNYAIELLASRRVENDLFLDLRISRNKDVGASAVPVTYSIKGNRTSERVTVTGQEVRFQIRRPLTDADEEGYGWVGLPSDNNPRDNAAYFAFGGEAEVTSWIVAEDATSESAEFLRKAAAPSFEKFTAEIITPAELDRIDWPSTSLIVWQAPLPTDQAAIDLTEFIRTGGSVIFFPPETSSPDVFLGLSWGGIEEAPDEEFFISTSWIKDDGPWRNGIDDTIMPLDQLRAVKRRAIQGDGSELAEWDDNSPLLVRHIEEAGTMIFIGTRADDRWSNLEYTALHLVAIQRMIQQGTDRLHAGYRALAGSDQAQTADDEARQRVDTFEDFEASAGALRGGVYRMGQRLVAVNRPSAESDPESLDGEVLGKLLEGTEYSLFTNDDSKDDLVSEAWRFFLALVLLFLLAEAILSLQPKPKGPPLATGAKSTKAGKSASTPPTSQTNTAS